MLERYTLPVRIMHWLVGSMIMVLLPVGFWMANLPSDAPGKYDFYDIHKSFGLLALGLVVLRITIRLRSQIPSLPSTLMRRDVLFAGMIIAIMYMCMLFMPISGYLMSTLGGHPVIFFGFKLPDLITPNHEFGKIAHNAHVVGGVLLASCLALHILGTIKHWIWDKTNLLKRIW
jgi:cytochrome b561